MRKCWIYRTWYLTLIFSIHICLSGNTANFKKGWFRSAWTDLLWQRFDIKRRCHFDESMYDYAVFIRDKFRKLTIEILCRLSENSSMILHLFYSLPWWSIQNCQHLSKSITLLSFDRLWKISYISNMRYYISMLCRFTGYNFPERWWDVHFFEAVYNNAIEYHQFTRRHFNNQWSST